MSYYALYKQLQKEVSYLSNSAESKERILIEEFVRQILVMNTNANQKEAQ